MKRLADNPPRFEARLKQLAKSHHTSYGVKIRHYKHFRTAFMRAIKKHIDMTERTEKAWMYVWDKIIFAMSSYGDGLYFVFCVLYFLFFFILCFFFNELYKTQKRYLCMRNLQQHSV